MFELYRESPAEMHRHLYAKPSCF